MYEIKYINVNSKKKYTKTFWKEIEVEKFVKAINNSKDFKLTAIISNSYLYS